MSYEYYLVPRNQEKLFTADFLLLAEQYLKKPNIYLLEDGVYFIYGSLEELARRVPQLIKRSKNNYLNPSISIADHEITLSAAADPQLDRYLYDFVLWCQQQLPCDLYYGSQSVMPIELITEA